MQITHKLHKDYVVNETTIFELELHLYGMLSQYLVDNCENVLVKNRDEFLEKHAKIENFAISDMKFVGQIHIYNEEEKYNLENHDNLTIIVDQDERYKTLPTKEPELIVFYELKKLLEKRLLNTKQNNLFNITISIFDKNVKDTNMHESHCFVFEMEIFTAGVWQKR